MQISPDLWVWAIILLLVPGLVVSLLSVATNRRSGVSA